MDSKAEALHMVGYTPAAVTLLNKVGVNRCHDFKRCKRLVFGTVNMQYAQKKKKDFVYSVECTIFVLTFSGE